MTLAAWLHDISPFAVRFTQDFGLRWYGLSYAAAFVIGWLILGWLARRRVILIPPERVGDAILLSVIGVVVGGRLGYVLVYERSLLWTFSDSLPWWGLLSINQGGMASHGGLVGVIVASFFISRGWKDEQGVRRGRMPVLHTLDALALITPSGLFLGRVANFINGELLGRVVAGPGQPAPAWSIKFPQEVLVGEWPGISKRTAAEQFRLEHFVEGHSLPGQTLNGAYAHIVDLIQHGNRELGRELSPLLSARVPSQLYQAAAEGIVVGVVVWWVARKPRLPGVVGAAFMISYGVLRIITEQFWRLPDAKFVTNPRPYGLSRGQWLSVGMIVVGVAFAVWIVRRGGEKLGGWGVSRKADAPATPSAH